MAKFEFDIGILGGGAAGLTAASGAAQFGARVLLVEKESRLGGDCLHYGCVPSKTLIKTAAVRHTIMTARKFGLPPAEAAPVDFSDVAARIRSVIDRIQEHDSVERFCRLGVQVEFGSARFTGSHSVILNGRTCSARSWLIATGSSPAMPAAVDIGTTPFLTNRDIFSLDRLPESMIIIGAGPVAIEMAQAFNRLGTEVTVVQRSSQILSSEDRDMADAVMGVLASEGVRFRLGATMLSVKGSSGTKEVVIEKNGMPETLHAAVILVALGRKPNLDGLGLEDLSLPFNEKGLTVDSRMRTNIRHIYAAGDVTGAYQFTHAAGYEAGIVLSNAILRLPRKADYRLMPWCTYTDPELAGIGMNEKKAAAAGIRYSVWTEEFRNNDRSLTEGEERGRIKLLLDEREKPLGVQIFGPHAGELISEWVAAFHGGVRLAGLAAAVHPYPTLAEINRKVTGSFFAGKIFSGKVKWALKFLFRLKGRACGQEKQQ